MSALRAVPDTTDPEGVDAPVGDPPAVDEPVDLTDDPRTDPAALALCALMWTTDHTEATRIAHTLTPGDFTAAAHIELFEVIRQLVLTGQRHDPASVLGHLQRAAGRTDTDDTRGSSSTIPMTDPSGRRGDPLRRILTEIATAGASGEALTHYAGLVLSESYRRSFHQVGQRITQAAEQGPEDELFDYLVELGRNQRTATRRLHTFRAGGTPE